LANVSEERMISKPIVAGVDQSEAGIQAATVASEVARWTGARCQLVHAVRDPWIDSVFEIPMDLQALKSSFLDSQRTLLLAYLSDKLPGTVLKHLQVRFGSPGIVIPEVAEEQDAELVVVGGKHHSAIGRWLAGSTPHHLVRTMNRPLLVTGPTALQIERVLAAVDLSSASVPTIDAAERFAKIFNAKLRALHVIEPWPLIPGLPMGDADVVRRTEEELERSIWPRISLPGADQMVREGPAAETIVQVAAEWGADLIVVGSHGRGWIDRLLIGSVTEKLLNRLLTSILVIPVASSSASPALYRSAGVNALAPA
jgi:nucleotide-binding universal stress UspA family protein